MGTYCAPLVADLFCFDNREKSYCLPQTIIKLIWARIWQKGPSSILAVLCGSSSRCHRLVCNLWLWYFLIILTYYFGVIKISKKTLNFQDCTCSYNKVKLLLTCNTFKAQIVLIYKVIRIMHLCCRGNRYACGLSISFNKGTSFQMLL